MLPCEDTENQCQPVKVRNIMLILILTYNSLLGRLKYYKGSNFKIKLEKDTFYYINYYRY